MHYNLAAVANLRQPMAPETLPIVVAMAAHIRAVAERIHVKATEREGYR